MYEDYALTYKDDHTVGLDEFSGEALLFTEPVERSDLPARVSLEDGYGLTRNKCGYIDLDYWSQITGYTPDEIITLANGKLIWRDPVQYELGADLYTGWLTKDQMLLGNRIKKYKHTIELNQMTDGLFDVNVKLLKENLPEMVDGKDIRVNLGSTWLLKIEGFLEGFIQKLLDMPIPPKLYFDSYRGEWDILCLAEPDYIKNNFTYGTLRMTCITMIKHRLNGKQLKIKDQMPRYDREGTVSVLNKAETEALKEKSRLVDEELEQYCHEDPENEERIQEAYMQEYGYGICRFDGSYLKLEDLNKEFSLYPRQKDALARIIVSPYVLLAEKVGFGKTFVYISGIHELIRMGLGHKALVVDAFDRLENIYNLYKNLFPMDKLLLCRPRKEFSTKNRSRILELMKGDEYDVVFLPSSSFDMITMSRKYMFRKKDEELRECRAHIFNSSNYAQRQKLHSLYKRMEKAAENYKEKFKDSELACMDELGFDILVVDEAHNYKNITLSFQGDSIVGMHGEGSDKADNMLEKVRYMQKIGGRVIFSTATPVANSLAELFVYQKYLQPEELELNNVHHFKDWVNTFCEENRDFEIEVDCKHGKFAERFSHFHNLPELMAMFSQVCDFYNGNEEETKLPIFHGSTSILVKKDDIQEAFFESLGDRADAIRNREVDRKEDNFLKITVEGRLVTLDSRLLKKDIVITTKDNKVKAVARNMGRFYWGFPGTTQIAYSDIGTPKEGFNIYDELKKELVAQGVKPEEIAYIHDAKTGPQRTQMEALFNEGKIRILIGSTAKLGTGANVQERLIASHNVDVPWRPLDMEQRRGRIVRRGNTCKEVYEFNYVVEGSFDAYSYQRLELKQKVVSQILSGTLSAAHRSDTDCANAVLSYAEIKALAIGNPLLRERVEASNELERAKINQRQKKKELLNLEELLEHMPSMIAKRRLLMANTEADIEHYRRKKESVKREERLCFGEELLEALKDNVMKEKERIFSDYQGFDVILPARMEFDKPYVIVKRTGSNQYRVSMKETKTMGCCQRLDHCLEHLPDVLEKHKEKLRDLNVQKNNAKRNLEIGNMYDDEVELLADKLAAIDEKLKEGKDS